MSRKEGYVPCQKVIGKKVIDVKGALIGEVKDIALDLKKPDIILKIMTETKAKVEITSSDIQSMEDIILLKKEVKIPKTQKAIKSPPSPAHPHISPTDSKTPETQVICQNCGMKTSSHAKFCPKCGSKIK